MTKQPARDQRLKDVIDDNIKMLKSINVQTQGAVNPISVSLMQLTARMNLLIEAAFGQNGEHGRDNFELDAETLINKQLTGMLKELRTEQITQGTPAQNAGGLIIPG